LVSVPKSKPCERGVKLMKRIIRLPGVLGFFVVAGLITVFFVLFLDNMLKAGLTSMLTKVNQAEVNIEQVELHWSPFAVDIKNLQMTNPEMPSHNRFEALSLRAEVRFLELFIGKVHIEDLTAAGVSFDSVRANAGKVVEQPEPEEEVGLRERLGEFNIELPTSKSFLNGANITTPTLLKEVEEQFNERRQRFVEARENLPAPEKFDEYKERINTVLDSRPRKPKELLEAREQLNEIKKDIRADKERVNTFLAASEDIVKETKKDLAEVKETYQADINRARELFSFDTDSLTELSGVMFGAQVEEWANYALMAFDFIAPLLENAKNSEEDQGPNRWQGRYVDFDTQSSPTFWVKNAHLSMKLQELEFSLAMQNLTWQHERINTPTEFQVTADNAPGWETFALNGDLFISNLGQVRGKQQWQLTGARLQDLELIGSSSLRTVLAQAQLNTEGSLVINNGELTGEGDLHFADTDFTVTGEGKVPQYLGQALQAINKFELNLGLTGQFNRPKFKLGSDLDHQLGAQFNTMLSAEAESRLAEVRTSLSAQSEGFMGEIEPWLEKAEAFRAEGKSLDEGFSELLNAELDDLVESEGGRLLDKLRKRTGN